MRAALLAALAVASLAPTMAPAAQGTYALERAFGNDVFFSEPTDLQAPPDGSNRLFIAEKSGRLRVIENSLTATPSVFLDLSGVVYTPGESGLLGLAFHPGYAENGFFYVNYVLNGPRRTRISRFTRSTADPLRADPASELVLLEVGQPFDNHNGGQLLFGPAEGPDGRRYLYVALGDGGGGGDPEGNGQNLGTLLGSILRLDVDGGGLPLDCGAGTGAATVPPSNPFLSTDGACDEIYAYGLRNPWRMSYDAPSGRLWAADVGQDTWEEVNVVTAGGNYGWDTMEGAHCFPPNSSCDQTGLTLPVWEYDRSQGVSVTGGYVYRGRRAPSLTGRYLYGDFVTSRIWALDYDGQTATNTLLLQGRDLITSFGLDRDGELYVLYYSAGIERLVDPTVTATEEPGPSGLRLEPAGPTPARGRTALRIASAEAGPARLALFDLLGREVAVLHEGPLAVGASAVVPLDAAAFAPGVYVARLTQGGQARTLKVVLAG